MISQCITLFGNHCEIFFANTIILFSNLTKNSLAAYYGDKGVFDFTHQHLPQELFLFWVNKRYLRHTRAKAQEE